MIIWGLLSFTLEEFTWDYCYSQQEEKRQVEHSRVPRIAQTDQLLTGFREQLMPILIH
jgi:hypothetical protein